MEIILTNFVAIVIGIFLSPALPEDMIKVGDPCEKAMAVVHEQGLSLVDQEFVPRVALGGPGLEIALVDAPATNPVGALTLSYDRSDSYGFAKGKKRTRTKAGFLMCALVAKSEENQ